VVGQAAVDRQVFEREIESARGRFSEVKNKLIGSLAPKVILFSGQLVPRKGVMHLFEAFGKVQRELKDVTLVIMGTGPLRADLEQYICQQGLSGVIFTGFISAAQFSEYYAIADIFVLPSFYDCFPIVVCEAMFAGVPVITTTQVGSAGNLVRDGETGLIVEPGNSEQLASAILRLLKNDDIRRKMGAKAREAVLGCSVDRVAAKMVVAFQEIAATAGRPHF
jgi:glycosyltransferase involved in cell wall biosynthesis